MGRYKTMPMILGNETKKHICELCGDRFFAPRKKKYCSRECQSEAMRKPYDQDKAISLYKSGYTMKQTAKEVGVSVATVRLLLWSNDIEIRRANSQK